MTQYALSLRGISKFFPGVVALDNVDLDVKKGEIHAIVGENGAGKSTLMKILCGAYRKDSGEIRVDGNQVNIESPQDAQKLGIAIIYQEFNLAPHLSAAANIFIGREPTYNKLGFINESAIRTQAEILFEQLQVDVDINSEVQKLSVCQQQFTEIAKALSMNPQILIMDEPTSALPEKEIEQLFKVIRRIQKEGVTVLYISHCLDEIFEIAETITVLRDGRHIITRDKKDLSSEEVIKHIVGEELSESSREREWTSNQDVIMHVEHLSMGNTLKDISFDLYRGEILGIAGLLGAGRTELFNCLFGVLPKTGGSIQIEGQICDINNPSQGVACGIGYVPEDRKLQGLFLELTTRSNISTSSLQRMKKYGFISRILESNLAKEYIQNLSIKVSSHEQQVINLSGGNQQKTLLARWLAINPKILLLDDPTRGIDVGARAAIHELIYQLAQNGLSVIFVSSELPEVMEVSDRILVLSRGQITGVYSHDEATKEKIMKCATQTSAAINAV
jgi:ribose transport system ATP-binding protein